MSPQLSVDEPRGACGAYRCACTEYVKGGQQAGWPSCARETCKHTQAVHAAITDTPGKGQA